MKTFAIGLLLVAAGGAGMTYGNLGVGVLGFIMAVTGIVCIAMVAMD